MKRKATPERLPSRRAAAQAHIRRWETPRTPTEDIRLKMVLNGWNHPQLVTIDDTVYVGALTAPSGLPIAVFITGEDGAYQIALAGNDPTVSAELQLPRIPSPGVICEIWRLINLRG